MESRDFINSLTMLLMSGRDPQSIMMFCLSFFVAYILKECKTVDFSWIFKWSKKEKEEKEYTISIKNEKSITKDSTFVNADNNYIFIDAVSHYIQNNNITFYESQLFTDSSFKTFYKNPEPDSWYSLTKDIQICYKYSMVSSANDKNDKSLVTTSATSKIKSYTLKCKSNEILTNFIKNVCDEYSKIIHVKDNNIYYYDISSIDRGPDKKTTMLFSRHPLNNQKQFESLFFNDKKHFLNILNNFIEKSGPYKLSGIQHRLGILLHGPPGTGKTSFIKALSNKLKRHIINIPLSKIKTNSELFELVYNLLFSVKNERSYIVDYKYEFKDVIFIIEDIDALGSIVNKRHSISDDLFDSDDDSSFSFEEYFENDKDSKDSKESKDSKDSKESKESKESKDSKDSLKKLVEDSKDSKDTKDTKDSQEQKKIEHKIEMMRRFKEYMAETRGHKSPDALNLASILNIIDGVIDCPERIMIFTTNHPENLDPALIRAGRIDYKLYMSCMNITTLCEMLLYYNIFDEEHCNTLVNSYMSRCSQELINKTGADIEQFIIKNCFSNEIKLNQDILLDMFLDYLKSETLIN
jgi:hypothetical protein